VRPSPRSYADSRRCRTRRLLGLRCVVDDSLHRRIGLESVPAVRLSHLDAAQRRAYILADNKLALDAGWDREILAIELQALIDLDFDVEITGFSLAEVDLVLDSTGVVPEILLQPGDLLTGP
jgi:hypothetical protein